MLVPLTETERPALIADFQESFEHFQGNPQGSFVGERLAAREQRNRGVFPFSHGSILPARQLGAHEGQDPRDVGAAELAGQRLIGRAQPLQPVVRVRVVAQDRTAFTFRQAAPHAVVRLGFESVGETFKANLAFIAAHTNLTLGSTLHEQHVRFVCAAMNARFALNVSPTLSNPRRTTACGAA